MNFLRRIFSKDPNVENKETVPDLSKIVSDTYMETTSQNVPEATILDPNPVNLMIKLFHNHKSAFSEGPETHYENEAWAPESDYVGLFRKHRIIIEEQSTSSSDS